MTQLIQDSGFLRSHDLGYMESFLRVCRCDLVLLEGSPRADLQSLVVSGALVCRVRLGMRLRGRFVLPRDWMLLLHLVQADGSQSWCHGMPMGSGNCLSVLPTGVAEFCLASGTEALVAVVPRELVAGTSPESVALQNVAGIEAGVRVHDQSTQFHMRTCEAFDSGEMTVEHLQEWIGLHRQARLQEMGATLSSLRARRSRYQIFRKAEDFMLANMRRQVYMQEICDAAGTSERTLRYAFDDLTGTSPVRYLSLLRLCAACRALTTADALEQSVKSVALSCGLWDLSRFADSYRNVFGELPRDTLQRMAG